MSKSIVIIHYAPVIATAGPDRKLVTLCFACGGNHIIEKENAGRRIAAPCSDSAVLDVGVVPIAATHIESEEPRKIGHGLFQSYTKAAAVAADLNRQNFISELRNVASASDGGCAREQILLAARHAGRADFSLSQSRKIAELFSKLNDVDAAWFLTALEKLDRTDN